jgi:ABC-type microcin C transport system permease subunit YejB
MKKTVLTFGLIGGAIIAVLMSATIPFAHKIGFDKGLIVGYTTMVCAFLLVYFGIRSYRENVGDGKISFGRAFALGILITLIVCLCYVVTWDIIYRFFASDFLDKYATMIIEKMKAAGEAQQAIDAKIKEINDMKVWYANPFLRAAMTMLEPLPVGLVMTLISSAILRKK